MRVVPIDMTTHYEVWDDEEAPTSSRMPGPTSDVGIVLLAIRAMLDGI